MKFQVEIASHRRLLVTINASKWMFLLSEIATKDDYKDGMMDEDLVDLDGIVVIKPRAIPTIDCVHFLTPPSHVFSQWMSNGKVTEQRIIYMSYHQPIQLSPTLKLSCSPSGYDIGGSIFHLHDLQSSQRVLIMDTVSQSTGRYPEPLRLPELKRADALVLMTQPSQNHASEVVTQLQIRLGTCLSDEVPCIFPLMPNTDVIFDLLDSIYTYLSTYQMISYVNLISEWMDHDKMHGQNSPTFLAAGTYNPGAIFEHTATQYEEWVRKGRLIVLPSVFHPSFVQVFNPHRPSVVIMPQFGTGMAAGSSHSGDETSKFLRWITNTRQGKKTSVFMLDPVRQQLPKEFEDSVEVEYLPLSFNPTSDEMLMLLRDLAPRHLVVEKEVFDLETLNNAFKGTTVHELSGASVEVDTGSGFTKCLLIRESAMSSTIDLSTSNWPPSTPSGNTKKPAAMERFIHCRGSLNHIGHCSIPRMPSQSPIAKVPHIKGSKSQDPDLKPVTIKDSHSHKAQRPSSWSKHDNLRKEYSFAVCLSKPF